MVLNGTDSTRKRFASRIHNILVPTTEKMPTWVVGFAMCRLRPFTGKMYPLDVQVAVIGLDLRVWLTEMACPSPQGEGPDWIGS